MVHHFGTLDQRPHNVDKHDQIRHAEKNTICVKAHSTQR